MFKVCENYTFVRMSEILSYSMIFYILMLYFLPKFAGSKYCIRIAFCLNSYLFGFIDDILDIIG
jgi:hypothetical protein